MICAIARTNRTPIVLLPNLGNRIFSPNQNTIARTNIFTRRFDDSVAASS
jgi:hypothetical protein